MRTLFFREEAVFADGLRVDKEKALELCPDLRFPGPGQQLCVTGTESDALAHVLGEKTRYLPPADALAIMGRFDVLFDYATKEASEAKAQAEAAEQQAKDNEVKAQEEDFARKRRMAYPSIGEQLGALMKVLATHELANGGPLGEIIGRINSVKASIPQLLPKPTFTWKNQDTNDFIIYGTDDGVDVYLVRSNRAPDLSSFKAVSKPALKKEVEKIFKGRYFFIKER